MTKSEEEKGSSSTKPEVQTELNGDVQSGKSSRAPSGVRCCATVATFTAAAGFSSLCLQTLSTYIVSQITSLEKQFGLTSTDSGVIVSCNDIGFLTTILFFSHYGRNGHIPRILGVSTIIYGLAGIACSISQFIEPASLPSVGAFNNFTSGTGDKYLCNGSQLNACASDSSAEKRSSLWVVYLVGVGLVVQGMCKSPRSPLSTVYIDNNVSNREKTGLYLGIMTTFTLFGPALAYGLGGIFSRIPVDLQETILNPSDPRWIGAWWLGFLIFGCVSLVTALPLFFIPRTLRGAWTKSREEQKLDPKHETLFDKIKALPVSLYRVLKSPIYTLCLVGVVLVSFTVGGYVSFGPKYLENVFGFPAWKANVIQGGQAAVSIGLGTFLGGYLTTRFKMNPRGCLKFVVGANLVSVCFNLLNFIFGCQHVPIVGLDSVVPQDQTCDCTEVPYLPVCGEFSQNTYFSPCHAGCLILNETIYKDCAMENGSDVTLGMCATGCPYLYPFVAATVLYCLAGTLAVIPAYIIMLRSVPEEDKSMAIGILSFSVSLLSFFPAPIVYGKLIDTTCRVWNFTCGVRGSCALYDIVNFRFRMVGTDVGLRALACVVFFIAFLLNRRQQKDEKVTLEKDSHVTTETPY